MHFRSGSTLEQCFFFGTVKNCIANGCQNQIHESPLEFTKQKSSHPKVNQPPMNKVLKQIQPKSMKLIKSVKSLTSLRDISEHPQSTNEFGKITLSNCNIPSYPAISKKKISCKTTTSATSNWKIRKGIELPHLYIEKSRINSVQASCTAISQQRDGIQISKSKRSSFDFHKTEIPNPTPLTSQYRHIDYNYPSQALSHIPHFNNVKFIKEIPSQYNTQTVRGRLTSVKSMGDLKLSFAVTNSKSTNCIQSHIENYLKPSNRSEENQGQLIRSSALPSLKGPNIKTNANISEEGEKSWGVKEFSLLSLLPLKSAISFESDHDCAQSQTSFIVDRYNTKMSITKLL